MGENVLYSDEHFYDLIVQGCEVDGERRPPGLY